jgi:glucose/arabinose dehydrogenase
MPKPLLPLLAGACALALAGCGGGPALPSASTYGPQPPLPPPEKRLLPVVKIAPARGWSPGARPVAAPGFQVNAFAQGLVHPRWLYVLPNGDVLVAETNGPGRKPTNLRAWIMGQVMKRAGAAVMSPNRITLLRDADGDGVAEVRSEFMTGLFSPFGMVLIGDQLYVANTDQVVRVPYRTGQTQVTATPQKVVELPAFPIDHHWTKNIIASPDGSKLYATVGSNSNVGENGLDNEVRRAAILQFNPDGSGLRVFASGLRNPNGLDWNPESGALWTAVNERDELGNDLVPDYMTSVKDGGFYGWPYSYWGRQVDTRVTPPRPDLVATAIAPDYSLGAHTASLGLTFYRGEALPPRYRGGAFVGQHGSWNRDPPAGYKVVFVPFAGGRPAGPPEDVLTGFLDARGRAQGRPVGVTVDSRGALLVADDVGNVIWRVTAAR